MPSFKMDKPKRGQVLLLCLLAVISLVIWALVLLFGWDTITTQWHGKGLLILLFLIILFPLGLYRTLYMYGGDPKKMEDALDRLTTKF